MRTIPKGTRQKPPAISKKSTAAATDDSLHHLTFDNSVQANIISITANRGNILKANRVACKLFGYSKKELLTKSRTTIWDKKIK